MNHLLTFIDRIMEFPTVIPGVIACVATVLMLLSILFSIEHFFGDAWEVDVNHGHDTHFSHNVIAFLGLKKRIPLIPLIALVAWGMTFACFFVTELIDLSSSWWRVILGIAFLFVILPVFSRIAYVLMLPLAKLIEQNSGQEYSFVGKTGTVSSINSKENYVMVDVRSEGVDSSLIIFVSPSEINEIVIGDQIIIAEQRVDPASHNNYYYGGKII